MKVSVILPSLNVEKYIEECMESVMMQSLRDIEIVCVDAGSTDHTIDTIKKYKKKDSRISLIEVDRKSYGFQVNCGIKHAKGDYIGIVDTDDYVDQTMFEQLFAIAEKTEYPDYVKGGYYSFVGSKEERLFFYEGINVAEYGKRINLLLDRKMGLQGGRSIWSGIYRRSFLLHNNIFFHETDGAAYQDMSFWDMIAILSDSCTYVDNGGYYYRIDNPQSSVKKKKWRAAIDEIVYSKDRLRNTDRVANPEVQLFLAQEMVDSLFWSFENVDQIEIQDFRDRTTALLKSLKCDTTIWNMLDPYRKSRVNIILEEDYGEIRREKEEKKKLVSVFLKEDGSRYIIIGAGRRGKKLLDYQRLAGKRIIVALGDNNMINQGKMISGYKVKSVSELLRKHRNDSSVKWFVACKQEGMKIFEQLRKEGIDENRIYVIKHMPEISEMISYLDH